MIKRSWKYGLLCSIFLIGIFAFTVFIGTNPFINFGSFLVDIVLFAVFVGFASYEFKNYANGGYLHFWQGMSIGFFVYIIAILSFAALLALYFLVNADFMAFYEKTGLAYYEGRRELWVEEFGQEAYDQQVQGIQGRSLWGLWGEALGKKVFAAVIPTPIMALILRKKPKEL